MATATKSGWFAVDKDGLAQIRADAPKSTLLAELISNSFDTTATEVVVALTPTGQRGLYSLIVEDNAAEGWDNLTHAYTLFAPSARKDDPTKRGRFNLGEKLALAPCIEAKIVTTKGTIVFNSDGSRSEDKKKIMAVGTRFVAVLRMTSKEFSQVEDTIPTIIPPDDVTLIYNDKVVAHRRVLRKVEASLPTVLPDTDGSIRNTIRKCFVHIVEPSPGENAMIYELGIPIVESGDRYHYNVMQKVPLNMNRDNVTPAYLRTLREVVAEATIDLIDAVDVNEDWVRVASRNPDATEELVAKVIITKFGDKVVAFDPRDREANNRATAKGYTVIAGRSLSAAEWANVKKYKLAPAAGQVFPTLPECDATTPYIPEDEWRDGMRDIAAWSKVLAKELMGVNIDVAFVNSRMYLGGAGASYRQSRITSLLTFNVATLGYSWFVKDRMSLKLILHEFAHEYEANHLCDAFADALCTLGSKAAYLALEKPELFQ